MTAGPLAHLENMAALYLGASRVRTMDISVDDTLALTWTSSGATADFEAIDMSGYSGQDITITGILDTSEWISIVEVKPNHVLLRVHILL